MQHFPGDGRFLCGEVFERPCPHHPVARAATEAWSEPASRSFDENIRHTGSCQPPVRQKKQRFVRPLKASLPECLCVGPVVGRFQAPKGWKVWQGGTAERVTGWQHRFSGLEENHHPALFRRSRRRTVSGGDIGPRHSRPPETLQERRKRGKRCQGWLKTTSARGCPQPVQVRTQKAGRPLKNPDRLKNGHSVAEAPVRDGKGTIRFKVVLKPQPRVCERRGHEARSDEGKRCLGCRSYAIHP